MESLLPIVFALGIGFSHAFEADHLVAIMNIVTKRSRTKVALKDGVYWGLGHTTTVLIVGIVIIVGKLAVNESVFGYLEGLVGLLLIVLGIVRMRNLLNRKSTDLKVENDHKVAYGVGLIHGLAGSGAVVLIAITEIQGLFTELFYLLSFGAGSIIGMLIAAGIFSLPFSKKFASMQFLQNSMIILSSLLCIGYGGYILIELF